MSRRGLPPTQRSSGPITPRLTTNSGRHGYSSTTTAGGPNPRLRERSLSLTSRHYSSYRGEASRAADSRGGGSGGRYTETVSTRDDRRGDRRSLAGRGTRYVVDRDEDSDEEEAREDDEDEQENEDTDNTSFWSRSAFGKGARSGKEWTMNTIIDESLNKMHHWLCPLPAKEQKGPTESYEIFTMLEQPRSTSALDGSFVTTAAGSPMGTTLRGAGSSNSPSSQAIIPSNVFAQTNRDGTKVKYHVHRVAAMEILKMYKQEDLALAETGVTNAKNLQTMLKQVKQLPSLPSNSAGSSSSEELGNIINNPLEELSLSPAEVERLHQQKAAFEEVQEKFWRLLDQGKHYAPVNVHDGHWVLITWIVENKRIGNWTIFSLSDPIKGQGVHGAQQQQQGKQDPASASITVPPLGNSSLTAPPGGGAFSVTSTRTPAGANTTNSTTNNFKIEMDILTQKLKMLFRIQGLEQADPNEPMFKEEEFSKTWHHANYGGLRSGQLHALSQQQEGESSGGASGGAENGGAGVTAGGATGGGTAGSGTAGGDQSSAGNDPSSPSFGGNSSALYVVYQFAQLAGCKPELAGQLLDERFVFDLHFKLPPFHPYFIRYSAKELFLAFALFCRLYREGVHSDSCRLVEQEGGSIELNHVVRYHSSRLKLEFDSWFLGRLAMPSGRDDPRLQNGKEVLLVCREALSSNRVHEGVVALFCLLSGNISVLLDLLPFSDDRTRSRRINQCRNSAFLPFDLPIPRIVEEGRLAVRDMPWWSDFGLSLIHWVIAHDSESLLKESDDLIGDLLGVESSRLGDQRIECTAARFEKLDHGYSPRLIRTTGYEMNPIHFAAIFRTEGPFFNRIVRAIPESAVENLDARTANIKRNRSSSSNSGGDDRWSDSYTRSMDSAKRNGNSKTNGHKASKKKNISSKETVKQMTKNSNNQFSTQSSGVTALHLAILHENFEAAHRLLEGAFDYGADATKTCAVCFQRGYEDEFGVDMDAYDLAVYQWGRERERDPDNSAALWKKWAKLVSAMENGKQASKVRKKFDWVVPAQPVLLSLAFALLFLSMFITIPLVYEPAVPTVVTDYLDERINDCFLRNPQGNYSDDPAKLFANVRDNRLDCIEESRVTWTDALLNRRDGSTQHKQSTRMTWWSDEYAEGEDAQEERDRESILDSVPYAIRWRATAEYSFGGQDHSYYVASETLFDWNPVPYWSDVEGTSRRQQIFTIKTAHRLVNVRNLNDEVGWIAIFTCLTFAFTLWVYGVISVIHKALDRSTLHPQDNILLATMVFWKIVEMFALGAAASVLIMQLTLQQESKELDFVPDWEFLGEWVRMTIMAKFAVILATAPALRFVKWAPKKEQLAPLGVIGVSVYIIFFLVAIAQSPIYHLNEALQTLLNPSFLFTFRFASPTSIIISVVAVLWQRSEHGLDDEVRQTHFQSVKSLSRTSSDLWLRCVNCFLPASRAVSRVKWFKSQSFLTSIIIFFCILTQLLLFLSAGFVIAAPTFLLAAPRGAFHNPSLFSLQVLGGAGGGAGSSVARLS